MKQKYFVYLDDGVNVFKIAISATDETDAIKQVEGNGELIAIKKADILIDYHKVKSALQNADFGYDEIMFMLRALDDDGIIS